MNTIIVRTATTTHQTTASDADALTIYAALTQAFSVVELWRGATLICTNK